LLDSLLQEFQRKKISWVHLDLAPVEAEEEEEVVVEVGEDFLPEEEAGEVAVEDFLLVEEVAEVLQEEAVEVVEVEEGWEEERKLSSSHTDTPGFSLPEERKMPW